LLQQIGKTSALVLTLCGVLKDILLVLASMAIWGTPVTLLQWFGYSIALGGMVYYKLGAKQIQGYAAEGQRRWAEYGAQRPAQRKMATFGIIVLFLFVLLGGLAPYSGVNPGQAVATSKQYLGSIVGGGKTGGS